MKPSMLTVTRRMHWLLLLIVFVGCADRATRNELPPLESPKPFSPSGSEAPESCWWQSFGDPQLDVHVASGLKENYSLQAAAFRINAARAVTRREASDFWPDIDGILGLGSRMGPGENVPNYSLGLDANWQVDLWGEIESRVEAQRLRANATCWDYQSAALALSGEISSVWFALIEARAQAELLQEQIKSNRNGLKAQEGRFGEGQIFAADVLRQRQLVESTLEQAVVIESQINLLEHQLAVLIGQSPQNARYDAGTEFPDLPPLPAAGLPTELILRRPDVLANYNALAAADADLASAISRLYPQLNLGGALQNIAEHPEDLFRDWIASVAAQLIAPLFDGGQRRAEIDRTAAVKLVLFNEYAQSVLFAYQQVEDALAQERFQLERIKHIKEQVKLAGQATPALLERYLIQDTQYLDYLSSIQAQQRLQRQLINAQLELRLIRVSLYLALAGNIDPNCLGAGYTESELLPEEIAGENEIRPVNPVMEQAIEPSMLDIPEPAAAVREFVEPPSPRQNSESSFIRLEGPKFGGSDPLKSKPPKNPLLDRLRGTTKDE